MKTPPPQTREVRTRAGAAAGAQAGRATGAGGTTEATDAAPADELVEALQQQRTRRERGRREGAPTLAQQLARVGVLGWMIVVPTLLGVWLGRLLDRHFHSGIFWTAPLLLCGLLLGCWSAWRWMHQT